MSILNKTFTLYNQIKIPSIGFGTWQIPNGDVAYQATKDALNCGYRHIDTAAAYRNEESVGKAIKDSNLSRSEIFITTKLPAEIKSYEGAKQYFHDSLKKLGVNYIDLYLIHAPWPWNEMGKDCKKEIVEVWKAFEEFYEKGLVRSIGISNFNCDDMNHLLQHCKVKPMVNQICYFIGNTQKDIVDYCNRNEILVEAYSPIATGRLLQNEKIGKIAAKYQKSIPQICIRFCLQNNLLPLPKSVHEEYIRSNIDVDFEIDQEDMAYLNQLENLL